MGVGLGIEARSFLDELEGLGFSEAAAAWGLGSLGTSKVVKRLEAFFEEYVRYVTRMRDLMSKNT